MLTLKSQTCTQGQHTKNKKNEFISGENIALSAKYLKIFKGLKSGVHDENIVTNLTFSKNSLIVHCLQIIIKS